MSEIINIGNTLPTLGVTLSNAQARLVTPTPHHSDEDILELSETGLTLSRSATESSLRVARASAIRAEIQAGTFETPERINGTVERLIQFLT